MAKVYEFIANGFEEVEALAPVDILRRGGVDIQTVSITGSEFAESAHGVTIKTDLRIEDADLSDADMLLLPGGMPGAANLKAHPGVTQALCSQVEKGKRIGAICAAPMVPGALGLLKGRKATCYPGFECHLEGAHYTAQLVEEDGLITTGAGPAAVFPYAYHILGYFAPASTVAEVEEGMRYTQLMNR